MKPWGFHSPVRIEFGAGKLADLGELIDYNRIALVTTPGFVQRGVAERVRSGLGERLVTVLDTVTPNPDVRAADAAAARLRAHAPDCILALGGGSSLDMGKAVAKLLASPSGPSLADHFREGTPLEGDALPLFAVPTTAGTGSEMTQFATIWDFETRRKHSLAGNDLYPAIAVLDPELTLGLPYETTVSSALDSISHAFESTWNRNAGPISLALASYSLRLSLDALSTLVETPDDLDSRGEMMTASAIAGIAISQTRTALAHSISYPLTAHLQLSHGLACSFTLPEILRFNIPADDGRLAALARILNQPSPAALADELEHLFERVGISALLCRKIQSVDQMLRLVDEMITPGRADNNLRDADTNDILKIVTRSGRALGIQS